MAARPRRPHLRRAAVALAATAATLAMAEAGLRVSGLLQPEVPLRLGDAEPGPIAPDLGVEDPELGWKLAPGQVIEARHPDHAGVVYRANAQGFRGERDLQRDAPAPDGERRIAFVGDSFTFGLGVELGDTFAEQTVSELGGRALNLGQAGFGVDQMERAVALWALRLAPRVVVVTFVDDDLGRSLSAYRQRGPWVVPKPTYVMRDGLLQFASSADNPSWLVRRLERTHLAEGWRKLSRRLSPRLALDARWRLNRAIFERMQRHCTAARVPLIVVHLPQRGRWAGAPGWRSDLEALGIAVLDLGEQAPPDPRALYFPRDPHLNQAGHAWVAERLARFLAERGLP